MTEVWYIRHGESEANAGLATETPGKTALTALGHQQARKAATAFSKAPDLIVTSKYTRAIQTAQYTIERFPTVPVETWESHEFTYLSPVLLGSTTMKERWPIAHAYWERLDPDYIHGEGAESFAEFIGRIKTMQDEILRRNGKFIAVFGHGFMMKGMLWAHLLDSHDVTVEYMQRFYAFNRTFDVPNCAVIQAEYQADAALFSGLITKHLE
jgi:broad specificity phosphatase PhoE